MATSVQSIKPISIKQGEVSADGTGINQFNPRTGTRLGVGEVVTVPQVTPTTTPDVLGTAPLTVRPQIQPTAAAGLEQTIATTNELQQTQQQEEINRLQETDNTYKRDFADLFGEQAGIGTRREQAFQDLGGDQARKEARDLSNQIQAEQLSSRRRQEELIKSSGGLTAGVQAEVRAIQRESASKQADLAIIQAAAQGKFADATEIADRKAQLETENLKIRSDALKFFYEDNKDQLTKAQDRKYQEAIKAEERKYEEEKERVSQINNLSLEAAKNQAPQALVQKALQAKTLGELMTIPGIGNYLQSPLERLQIQKAKLDINKLINESATNGLSEKQREELIKDPTVKQTAANIGVLKLMQEYKAMLEAAGGSPSKSKRKELNAYVETVIGPAQAVANGQGALSNDEMATLKRNLGVEGIGKRESVTLRNLESTITGTRNKIENGLSTVESSFPGASQGFQLFKDYETMESDPLFINESNLGENRLGL